MDATTQHHEPKHVRVEDNVLVRGHGRYVADAPLPNQAYAYFVRSPHAFARIVSVDTAAALKAPGVVGVLTAKDMDGVGNLGRHPPVPGRGGKGLILPHRPALAGERVDAYRRAGGDGGGGERGRGAGRRRAGRGRIRGADAGHRRARGAARRRAANLAAGARQSRGRLAGAEPRSRRQCQEGRRDFRVRQTCRRASRR